MKKLDFLTLKSYIGPLIVTFFITLFVLVMQFFWLYMDELLGKGLGVGMILKLLLFMSPTLVPMALPLAILLASIMTLGNFGENYELVAVKSSGISLNRFLRPLTIFIILISGFAFFFNNNIIPVTNLKALSLLYDLRNAKPTLNIRQGQFNNDIKGYAIRIGKKENDGQSIKDIIIYDQTEGISNTKMVIARAGKMIPSPDNKYIIFRLQDGWRYESGKGSAAVIKSFTRMHFDTWDKVFDISSFKVNRTDESLFKNAYQMMDVMQLSNAMDSLDNKTFPQLTNNINSYLNPYINLISKDTHITEFRNKVKQAQQTKVKPIPSGSGFITQLPDTMQLRVMEIVSSNVKSMKDMVTVNVLDRRIQTENYSKIEIEFHKKFTLSFACLLLFLIGAPLGAIIRKGGVGMPLIIAIFFFLIWFIISTVGEKMARTGSLPAWLGMWMSTFMLLPIAFIMMRAAGNDANMQKGNFFRNISGFRWSSILNLFDRKA